MPNLKIRLVSLVYLILLTIVVSCPSFASSVEFCQDFYGDSAPLHQKMARVLTARQKKLFDNEQLVSFRQEPIAPLHSDGSIFSSQEHLIRLEQIYTILQKTLPTDPTKDALELEFFDQGYHYLKSLGLRVFYFSRDTPVADLNRRRTYKTSPEIIVVPKEVTDLEDHFANDMLKIVGFKSPRNRDEKYDELKLHYLGFDEVVKTRPTEKDFLAAIKKQSDTSAALSDFNLKLKLLSPETIREINHGMMESNAFTLAINSLLSKAQRLLGRPLAQQIAKTQFQIMSHLRTAYSDVETPKWVKQKNISEINGLINLVVRFNPSVGYLDHPVAMRKAQLYFETIENLLAKNIPFSDVLWMANEVMYTKYNWTKTVDPEQIAAATYSRPWGLLEIFISPDDAPPAGVVRVRMRTVESKLGMITPNRIATPIIDGLKSQLYLDIRPNEIGDILDYHIDRAVSALRREIDYKKNIGSLFHYQVELQGMIDTQIKDIEKIKVHLKLIKISLDAKGMATFNVQKLESKLKAAESIIEDMKAAAGEIGLLF